jgi:hypothetical protein
MGERPRRASKLRHVEQPEPIQDHILTLLEISSDIYALSDDAAIFKNAT